MIEVGFAGSAAMMDGLLDRMNAGGNARALIYSGTRPTDGLPSTPPLCVAILASPAGTVSLAGELSLSIGTESSITLVGVPTWARITNGNEEVMFICDARLSSAPDTGQELVINAPSGMYVGALVQVISGTFSTLP